MPDYDNDPTNDFDDYLGSTDSSKADIIKVSAKSRSTAVAGAIAAVMREHRYAEVQAIGAGAVNQAVKALAIARTRMSDEDLFQARAAMEAELRPYRSKFTTDQLARLERQFLDRWMFERTALPRYSIFYLR